jgi:hypothetical protein
MSGRFAEHAVSEATLRSKRADAWREKLRGWFAAHDLSVEQWAEKSGVGQTRAHQMYSHRGGAALPVHDIETLPEQVRREVVEALAGSLGCTLAAIPGADDLDVMASDVLRLATVAKESSDVVASYASAIADASISAAEAETIERECTEAMQAFATLRERARSVRKERVVGVRVLRRVEGS